MNHIPAIRMALKRIENKCSTCVVRDNFTDKETGEIACPEDCGLWRDKKALVRRLTIARRAA